MVKPIPDNYGTVTPYLIIRNAAAALEFYQKAFGAEERMRLSDPNGKIGHAEIKIGNSIVMLADEYEDMDILGPESRGGTTVSLLVYVEDVDAAFEKAVAAGASEVRPLVDQFYGDRSGTIQDPYGHMWTIATHIEDVEPAEAQRRFDEFMNE